MNTKISKKIGIIEKLTSGKIVVISDMHLGAILDKTADEETNISDLLNCFELIDTKIKPDKIILLGDIFDIWRAKFEDIWSLDKKLIYRFLKINCDIVYLPGNHDHYIAMQDYIFNDYKRIKHILLNKKTDDYNANFTKNLICSINNKKRKVRMVYPSYAIQINDNEILYFEHGHYADGVVTYIDRLAEWLIKFLNKYIFKELKGSCVYISFWKVFNYIESSLTAAYSLTLFMQFDRNVKTARDLFTRFFLANIKLQFFISLGWSMFFGLIVGVFYNFSIILVIFIMILVFLFNYYLYDLVVDRILKLLNFNVKNNSVESSVESFAHSMINEEIMLKKPGYTYLDFIRDDLSIRQDQSVIVHYIFGHTHIAGHIKMPNYNLNLYNSGAWLKKIKGKNVHCFRSFIIIDLDKSDENKIKIYHMSGKKMVQCRFDENGNCLNPCY